MWFLKMFKINFSNIFYIITKTRIHWRYEILLFYITLMYIKNSVQERMVNMERIVGGTTTDITTCPYMVTIQKHNFHVCAGSIIQPRMILTAAHCFVDPDDGIVDRPEWYTVYAGTSDSKDLNLAQNSKIYDIIPHPEMDKIEFYNDLAIVILYREFKYNMYVQPLKLARPDMFLKMEPHKYFSGSHCVVNGWGYIKENALIISKELRTVSLPIVDNYMCEDQLPNIILNTQLCTLDPNGDKDVCGGDSGGALNCKGLGVAIVSWGIGCARKNSPGVWTRIDTYTQWIDKLINETNSKKVVIELKSGQTKNFINLFYIILSIFIVYFNFLFTFYK